MLWPTEPVEPRIVTPRGVSCDGAVQAHHAHGQSPAVASRISGHDDEHGDQPVDAVEHAAMSGNQTAAVLHARAALGRQFEQVAALRDHGEDERRSTASINVSPGSNTRPQAALATAAQHMPPIRPDQVLLGADARRELGAAGERPTK